MVDSILQHCPTIQKRFWEKVEIVGDCCFWRGFKGKDGRGRISVKRGMNPLLVTHLSWIIHFGAIPPNSQITQTCKNTDCVAPGHLKIGAKGGPLEIRFWRRVRKTETCWLWEGAISSGYGHVNVGKNRFSAAHRISWELTYGAIPEGLWVLHKCGVRSCVRPDHLFLGTHETNMADMVEKGRSNTGERHFNARLSDVAVKTIRERHAQGENRRVIAKDFGIAAAYVNKLIRRETRSR